MKVILCFVFFLSIFLRVIQRKLVDSNINLSPSKVMESLDQIKAIPILTSKNVFWTRTQITDINNRILRSLGCKIPPLILKESVVG